MSDLYFTRARLRDDVPSTALRALLVPANDSGRAGAGHKLVWTLFADHADRDRDFLWRESRPGEFFILSRRTPEDRHGLFELDPPKSFAPLLKMGDRLRFSLRANATIARPAVKGVRGKRSDVVMHALHNTPHAARATERARKVSEAGLSWLAKQGNTSGFRLPGLPNADVEHDDTVDSGPVRITSYRTLRVEHRGPVAKLGVLDFEGVLEVTNSSRFLDALQQGFGRAKAFGCGLMLIRRYGQRV